MTFKRVPLWHWVNSIISGRSPPLYCTPTLIAMQGHQKNSEDKTVFSKHNNILSMEMSRLTRDGTAEPVSRDQNLRHARGQGNVHFPCSADHEHDWQLYPVDPYSAISDDNTYIQWLPARNHTPPRHILHEDGMELSHSQSGAPPGTRSIPSREQSSVCCRRHMALPRES